MLCAEGQLERMKVQSYHDWFRAGVAHWLDIAVYKALKRIDRAVEFDTLQAVDNTVQYSSSAVDTLTIFYQIKVFWTQLAWPDMEGSYTFVAKIIDVSSVYLQQFHLLLVKYFYAKLIYLLFSFFVIFNYIFLTACIHFAQFVICKICSVSMLLIFYSNFLGHLQMFNSVCGQNGEEGRTDHGIGTIVGGQRVREEVLCVDSVVFRD